MSFDGISFSAMSDGFLLEAYEVLSVRTSDYHPNPDDWAKEWQACRDEIQSRLAKVPVE